RSKKQVDVVLHRGSKSVVGNIGEWAGVVGWNNWFSSKRVSPFFVESKKFLHQIIREKSDHNTCLCERSMSVHRFVFVGYAVHNSRHLALDQTLRAGLLRRLPRGARL